MHRGSTSQDILDTGAMLVADRALHLIRADLAHRPGAGPLAARHRDTLEVGRTLALHAVPTTFGLKAAGWRHLLLDAGPARPRARGRPAGLPRRRGRHPGRLPGVRGPADRPATRPGTYPDRLTDAFAAQTGLARPALPWHALRTPIADLASALAFTTGALGKIAVDVQSLTRTEVGEVSEPGPAGRGTSSAMPHKRNPVLATLMRSAALQVPALATGLTQCLLSEDERSAGAWHAEWQLLRECLRLTGGAAHTAVELAEGLQVRPERMRANLDLTGSRIVSERVAAHLAPRLGKARAKTVLTEAAQQAGPTAGRSRRYSPPCPTCPRTSPANSPNCATRPATPGPPPPWWTAHYDPDPCRGPSGGEPVQPRAPNGPGRPPPPAYSTPGGATHPVRGPGAPARAARHRTSAERALAAGAATGRHGSSDRHPRWKGAPHADAVPGVPDARSRHGPNGPDTASPKTVPRSRQPGPSYPPLGKQPPTPCPPRPGTTPPGRATPTRREPRKR